MQRRHFLQNIASGCVVANSFSPVATKTDAATISEEKPRVKVGQIGTKHAHAGGQIHTLLAMSDLYEFVGYVEPDEQRYKQIAETPVYRNAKRITEKELLETQGLQVVAVETEVRDLLATAQKCLNAGLHVHVDKPAGLSLKKLEQLHQTAEEKSLTIQMGYMYRYNPGFQFLFHAVQQGMLGEIFEIDAVMNKKAGLAERKNIAKYPGGTMFELGCHLIDPLLHMMGTPDNVTSFNRQTTGNEKMFDNMLAVFEYPKATATIRSAVVEVQGHRRRQFIVCGTKGTIEIRPLEPAALTLTLEKEYGNFKAGKQTVKLEKSKGRYHGCWAEVANVIRKQVKFPFTHKHDLAVQKAILAASGVMQWKQS